MKKQKGLAFACVYAAHSSALAIAGTSCCALSRCARSCWSKVCNTQSKDINIEKIKTCIECLPNYNCRHILLYALLLRTLLLRALLLAYGLQYTNAGRKYSKPKIYSECLANRLLWLLRALRLLCALRILRVL